MMMLLRATASIVVLAASGLAAVAQDWPAKQPLRLISPFPPGATPESVGRPVFDAVSRAIGQTYVFENRVGAGGTIGMGTVARAEPDGYTLLVNSSVHTITPITYPNTKYVALDDLVPIIPLAQFPNALVVPAARYKTIQEMVAFGKANPGKLTYGTPGNGTSPHIAGEMLKSQAGIYSVHIPYKGSGAVLQDLLGGQLDYSFDPGIAFQHIKSGKLRLLAMGSAKRSPLYPNTPTLAELGLQGFDTGTTHGFWAPAGTPAAIVERMNAEINKALLLPAVADAIKALGAEPTPMSPAQFGALTRNDLSRYSVIVKERKITSD